ncbi:acetyltransferase CD1211 [Synergistales bacterium]|nr:acetyltransferase CD1211 [Synergistales bacterium]
MMEKIKADIEIKSAYDALDAIRSLFDEYAASLGIDLSFQNYKRELDELPGKYAPPLGRLYLARVDGVAAGCVALRPFGDDARADRPSEMKRLYVRPEFRGLKLGRALIEKIIADARVMNYSHILLDTLDRLEVSLALYKKMGFYEIAPYYHNPYQGAIYLRFDIKL